MSSKVRNIIAITVGVIAVTAIIAVIVLASIRIRPLEYDNGNGGWLTDRESVVVWYGGNMLSGENADGKLSGYGEENGVYSYDDLFDMMSFSLFTACLQGNYGFGLSLSDTSDIRKSEVTVSELKTVVSEARGSDAEGYTFFVTLPEARTLSVSDDAGRTGEVSYDTVMFRLTTRNNWVANVEAYAYLAHDLNVSTDETGADSKVYYSLTFGARTEGVMDTLDAIYDITSDAPATDDSTDDTTDDTTDGSTDGSTDDTTSNGTTEESSTTE